MSPLLFLSPSPCDPITSDVRPSPTFELKSPITIVIPWVHPLITNQENLSWFTLSHLNPDFFREWPYLNMKALNKPISTTKHHQYCRIHLGRMLFRQIEKRTGNVGAEFATSAFCYREYGSVCAPVRRVDWINGRCALSACRAFKTDVNYAQCNQQVTGIVTSLLSR